MAQRQAALPTYRTAARVLEGEKGSGLKLAGWTIARTFMIAPPMMVFGVPTKQAFAGATFASGLISLFTMLRIFDARNTGMAGLKSPEAIRYRQRRARLRASR
jgi:hypothetical protein